MTEIAVVGAGTMGHALALVFALGGHNVRLTDSNPATLDRAPGLMAAALATLVAGGEADPGRDRQWLSSAVRIFAELAETVRGAEIIVEAIVEQPDAKRALFGQLDELMALDAILASNTSYLDVFPLLPERRQSRALIAHWYTPPYLVDLVDICPGPHTAPEVVERMRSLVAAMGKAPVVFRQMVSGYVANRLQAAIALEVFNLLDEGLVTPQDIDQSVIHGLALRIPVLAVLAKADFTGLELQRMALANGTYAPPVPTGRSATLDRLIAEGRTGVMAGKGFFDWGGRSPEELFTERDRKLIALKRAMRDVGSVSGS